MSTQFCLFCTGFSRSPSGNNAVKNKQHWQYAKVFFGEGGEFRARLLQWYCLLLAMLCFGKDTILCYFSVVSPLNDIYSDLLQEQELFLPMFWPIKMNPNHNYPCVVYLYSHCFRFSARNLLMATQRPKRFKILFGLWSILPDHWWINGDPPNTCIGLVLKTPYLQHMSFALISI